MRSICAACWQRDCKQCWCSCRWWEKNPRRRRASECFSYHVRCKWKLKCFGIQYFLWSRSSFLNIYIFFFFIVWYFFIFYRTNTSRNTEQLTVIQSASKWSVAAYLLSETDKLHVETIWRPRLRLTRRHDGRNLNLRLVLFPWIRTDCRSVSPQRCPHYFSLKSEWLSLQPQHEKLSECFIWNKARLWAGSKPVSV